MGDDDLHDLLSSLHGGSGQVVSSGSFTLDLRKAREKLSKYQLAEPCFYLMKVLQAAVAAGAERIDIALGRRTVNFYACLPPDGPLAQAQPLIDGLQDPQSLPVGALRHLAIGLNSAWSVDPSYVSVTWWSGGSGWMLVIGQEEIQLQPCPGKPAKPAADLYPTMARFEFTLERAANVSSYVRSVASEHMGILHRCAFCPVPLYLDARRVIGQFAPPEALPMPNPEHGAPYMLAERFLVDHEGGFQLCAPPWDKVKPKEHSLIDTTELVTTEGQRVRFPTFSFQGLPKQGGDTVRVRMALALPSTTSGTSRIVLVKDGVTLEPVGPPRMSHIGLQAIVSAPDIKVDLSEFTAIQDETLFAYAADVMRELGLMIDEVKLLSDHYPLHRINTDSVAATGCGYMLGCMFLNVIGVGIVAFFQWLSHRATLKQHVVNRQNLRGRLHARLDELSRTLGQKA